MTQDNENLNPQGQASVPDHGVENQTPASGTPAQVSKYETLAQKKGFKSHDDLAGSYESLEQEHSKKSTVIDKAKKQLQEAGYTLNDDGTIAPLNNNQPNQNSWQQPVQQQSQEVIYDPYTGQPISDPIAMQLARMPLGQREAFLFNAMQDQRERQQTSAYQADSEILSKPEAKGFEDDVRKAMMLEPLNVRANKEAWNKKLLEIKGTRYDQDRQKWAQQGAEDFINKEGLQGLKSQGGSDSSGVSLSPEQEQQFKFYSQNQPGLFKDRRSFLMATMPSYGR